MMATSRVMMALGWTDEGWCLGVVEKAGDGKRDVRSTAAESVGCILEEEDVAFLNNSIIENYVRLYTTAYCLYDRLKVPFVDDVDSRRGGTNAASRVKVHKSVRKEIKSQHSGPVSAQQSPQIM